MEYEYKKIKLTDKELSETFPEAKEMIIREINELSKIVDQQHTGIEKELIQIYSLKLDSFSEWFSGEIVKCFMMPNYLENQRVLLKLKRLYQFYKPTTFYIDDFENKLARARDHPILDIASQHLELKKMGRSHVGLCPYHQEKNPSCHFYPDSNRFKCYGCGEAGDVINLTQYLNGVDFKGAVEILQN
jgi:hypothetical protein